MPLDRTAEAGVSSGSSCPACNSDNVRTLGELDISPGAVVARAGTQLLSCEQCGLAFRPAHEAPGGLLASYASLNGEHWSRAARPDHQLVATYVRERLSVGAVLDVGCWEGELLASLGPSYHKYGLEPSLVAARVAASRGVELLGSALDNLEGSERLFDAVVMVDVIEHVPDPLGALRSIARLLRPGGFAVVTTGNRDALTWQLMPLDYWYYSSDHITFLSLRWFTWAAEALDMPISTTVRFSHTGGSLLQRGRDLSAAAAFRCLCPPRPSLAGRRSGWRGRVVGGRRPWTVHWQDHLLVTLERGGIDTLDRDAHQSSHR